MNRHLQFAPWFDVDFEFRTAWCAEQGGAELAERFVDAVELTTRKLAENPHVGRRRHPRDPDLAALYSIRVERPFRSYILFYRFTHEEVFLERLMHGACDSRVNCAYWPGRPADLNLVLKGTRRIRGQSRIVLD